MNSRKRIIALNAAEQWLEAGGLGLGFSGLKDGRDFCYNLVSSNNSIMVNHAYPINHSSNYLFLPQPSPLLKGRPRGVMEYGGFVHS